MLEVAFDSAKDDVFLDEKRSVYQLDSKEVSEWSDYKLKAKDFIERFRKERIVIVRVSDEEKINLFATALFVESCLVDNEIECVVFRGEDYRQKIEAYKPFVALCIAIKYVLRLSKENSVRICQECTELGYLGVSYQKDYEKKHLYLFLKNGKKSYHLVPETFEDALAAVGILKAFSLAKIPVSVTVDIDETLQKDIDLERIVDKIVHFFLTLIASKEVV